MDKPYNSLGRYLRERFGARVFKVTLDAGFTCPNRDGSKGLGGCIYCAPETLRPKGFQPAASITEQLNRGIERVRRRHRAAKFIAYFQINTNTHGPLDYLRAIYEEAAAHEAVAGLAVSTRPDCVGEEVLTLLAGIKEKKDLWLELGLQTANDSTLEFIGRGHNSENFSEAVLRAAEAGIEVCVHVILGLPGEGRTEIVKTMAFLSGLPVWGVKFHQLQIIKGTVLEKIYREDGIRPPGLEEYMDLVIECLELTPPEVVIHRLFGDTPAGFLAAPGWGLNKFIVQERILKEMRRRGTRQGRRCARAAEAFKARREIGPGLHEGV